MGDSLTRQFAYARSVDQDQADPPVHPVIVVGAGPVGLALAIDLAQRGTATVLLDDDDTLSSGSRAICFSKRTLEIFDRLGCGEKMVAKGVSWNVGKVFLNDELLYSFNLLPDGENRRPAFVNLQQYYVEAYLVERARALPRLQMRWSNRVTQISQDDGGVLLVVETPEGPYRLRGDYVVCADGSRSSLGRMLGMEARGHSFRDRFLIADVKMKVPFPAERWFWFDPPFHRNQSALLHRQPDDVWRIDFQLGWDADPVLEREPERVMRRVRAMLGPEVEFELEWVSVYTFSCTRMERFRTERIFFAGDAAHGVSPFGARGANGGVQDAENLAWKLAWVLSGRAPPGLLDSYEAERIPATDENILNSTRSTDFITPKTGVSRTFRDAVLRLAKRHEFARTLVNSGRLSVPATLSASPLNAPDEATFAGAMRPGAPCVDAPLYRAGEKCWLLDYVGRGFVLLFARPAGETDSARGSWSLEIDALRICLPDLEQVEIAPAGATPPDPLKSCVVLHDRAGFFSKHYDFRAGSFYLVRPDQHVCARGRQLDARAIALAHASATAASPETVNL